MDIATVLTMVAALASMAVVGLLAVVPVLLELGDARGPTAAVPAPPPYGPNLIRRASPCSELR